MTKEEITLRVYEVLCRQKRLVFPLEPGELQVEEAAVISFQRYQEISGLSLEALTCRGRLRDGCCIRGLREKPVILYDAFHPARARWTVAHEVCHLLLGHAGCGPREEWEADYGASQLLAPDAALLQMSWNGVSLTVPALSAAFGLSRQAAGNRLRLFVHPVRTAMDERLCRALSLGRTAPPLPQAAGSVDP